MNKHAAALQAFEQLLEIMAKLRDPDDGCPWDIQQTFETIAPYTLEEAYEVNDAIQRGNMGELKDELGDLLLQVVFHAQIADDNGDFEAKDVIASINEKMVRRHPHVFGDTEPMRSAEGQKQSWEDVKAAERAGKSKERKDSALSGVALALPALLRAEKLQKRAARTGFDWTEPEDIFEKLEEETEEVREALASGNEANLKEEIGDLLFVTANLARRLEVDPEEALRSANAKFERRFSAMETLARQQDLAFETLSLEEQEALWQSVKQEEKAKQ